MRSLDQGQYTFGSVGLDGSQWILEGVRGGEYHVVDRWSPKDNSYSQLCKYLLRLGKVEAALLAPPHLLGLVAGRRPQEVKPRATSS